MLIYDNDFIEKEEIDRIHNLLTDGSKNFPWMFSKATNEVSENNEVIDAPLVEDSWQLVHTAMVDGKQISAFHQDIKNLLTKFAEKNNIRVLMILRSRANLMPQDKGANGKHHFPHIDSSHQHMVFLYYVNDSDGDTILFDKRYGDDLSNIEDCIAAKVSPKAGAAIVFNGNTYHASSSPINTKYRAVINVNFIGKIIE